MADELKLAFKISDPECGNVKTDSREIHKDDIFVAVNGTSHDGHDHVREALSLGASMAICDHDMPEISKEYPGKVIVFEDTRCALACIAKKAFKDPSSRLPVYGVTGTNGKTTTVFLIDSILNTSSIPAGFVSTVFIKVSGERMERASMTTPDVITVNRLLKKMIEDGKSAAVLEISSHALAQKRVWGIGLDSAVFTNITPEHLDYHGNMQRYLEDKARIFRDLKPGGTAVLNIDDPMIEALSKTLRCPRLLTFGLDARADLRAEDIKLSMSGSQFRLSIKGLGSIDINMSLIGKHNVYNALAAAAALVNSGIGLEKIKTGIEASLPVPGRLDPVESAAPFRVFVDYAHTPNALLSVLECLRPLAKRLICVFGCGGDRDRLKRPLMGEVAARICDRVVLTSDNPRSEVPADILGDIEKGMSNNSNYSIMEQRKGAITEALNDAGEGDIVIIAGKGHEDYQIVKDQVLPFDDKKVAGEVLARLGY